MVVDILTIVLIILVASLCIYFFVTLKKLNRSIDVLSADVHRLIDSAIPMFENLSESSRRLNKMASDAERHMEDFNEMVSSTKAKVNSLTTRVKEGKTHNPAINLINNLNALSKGISAFWENYKS